LEELLSEQTQGLQLADAKRQIKHQGAFNKEKYGASRLQLRLMQWADRGISVSSFHPLSFCNFLLELVAGSNRSADGFSSEYRVVQKAAQNAFLHRNHNNHVIFNQIQSSIQASKREFKDEFTLLLLRAKKKFFSSIELWLNNLV